MKLVQSQKGVENRVQPTELWRAYTHLSADGAPSG
jgi:hypothetical protein